MATSGQAFDHINNGGQAKREIVQNDTVIINYKNRFYNLDKLSDVRHPYTPSNSDLVANDWVLIGDDSNSELLSVKAFRSHVMTNEDQTVEIKLTADNSNHKSNESVNSLVLNCDSSSNLVELFKDRDNINYTVTIIKKS